MSNPFKAFVPYTITESVRSALKRTFELDDHEATDPTGGMWRTVGLIQPLPGDGTLLADLENCSALCVQFNERILPGKVRDETLKKRVAELEDREGRKVGKKEYAQLRDQVEFDLLPRAFIRRTNVPVIRTGQWLIVCTSSAKRADDVIALLRAIFGEDFNPQPLQLPLTGFMRDVLLEGQVVTEDEMQFNAGCSVVLKGDDKETIRIKDKDVTEHDIFALAKSDDYLPAELEVSCARHGEEILLFNLKTSCIFTKIELPGVKATKIKEDLAGHLVLCASTYRTVLNELSAVVNGDDDDL